MHDAHFDEHRRFDEGVEPTRALLAITRATISCMTLHKRCRVRDHDESTRTPLVNSPDTSLKYSARAETLGTLAMRGARFSVDRAQYDGTASSDIFTQHDLYACIIDGHFDETAQAMIDGRRVAPSVRGDVAHSILVPAGSRLVTSRSGNVDGRYLICEIDAESVAPIFGESLSRFELRPHFGTSPMPSDIAKRLATVCYEDEGMELIYKEALTTVFAHDLYRAFGVDTLAAPPSSRVGRHRFKQAFEYIEASLDQDIGLHELAAIVGLSASHFSHAFKEAYGVSPYRFVLQRRIMRAKALLVSTNETIAEIALRVGFSSQSLFTKKFSSYTGFSPTSYRAANRR
jgi:AraC-like DNA-binding protein